MSLSEVKDALPAFSMLLAMAAILGTSLNSCGLFFWLKKRSFAQFGAMHGFKVGDGKLSKTLDGFPVTFELQRVASGKGHCDLFKATLKLPACPCHYSLRAEGLLSGFSRVARAREATFGDENFDHAFWLATDDIGQLRDYLTPARRAGLIYAIQDRSTSLSDNTISVEKRYGHPFYGHRIFKRTLDRLEAVARIFAGDETVPEVVSRAATSVAARKVSKFVPWAVVWSLVVPSFLWSLLRDFSSAAFASRYLDLPSLGPMLSLLGVASALFALSGLQIARLLLQSYFAFLSLTALLMPLVATTFWPNSGDFGTKFFFITAGLITAVLTWGVRHYLKSLERPLVALSAGGGRDDSPHRPKL
jgi:hypothetical protein